MDSNSLKRRDSTLDIIRIVALFTVVSVHFFLYTGFYSTPYNAAEGPIASVISAISNGDADELNGLYLFIMFAMRTFLGVCVPLFIILTGYLMSKKTLSRAYYKGIRKTLIIFVLASVACFIFRVAYVKETYDVKEFFFGILNFTHANYAWYVEMYIGLFLIAPFLNLAYNKLNTKRQKQVLVLSFVFLSTIPTALNIFNFDSADWWLHPNLDDTYQKLVPAFWLSIYPITYYFSGMYLREFGLRIKTKPLAALLGISVLVFTAFNIYRAGGGNFKTGSYGYWYGFYPYIESVLLFELLRRIKTDNWNENVKYSLYKVSDLVFGAYLMSWVTDKIIYDVLTKNVYGMFARLPYYFLTVPASFLGAISLSFALNLGYKGVMKLYEKIKKFVIAQRAKDTGYMWQDILFYSLFAAVLIISVWKCSYGFGGNDETFYLTIPHRLIQGDALFTDEWHLSQLSGFLLIPFTWLYTTLFQTTEGIILAARICYIAVHAAASVLIYTRLRKYGYITVFGVVLYFLFTPYDIMALSYDSMGLELVILTGVLLGTADYDKKLWIILSGLTFAGAVLCNPYLAVGYVLYGICVAVHVALKKKDMNFALKSEMFAPRTFLGFTIGVGALAVIFMIFLLLRTGIGDVFKNLPYMLEDPEHQNISFGVKIGSYFKSIFNCHDLFKYLFYAYGVTLLAMLADRKRRYHRTIYLIISGSLSVLCLMLFLPDLGTKSYNSIMFPMIFVTVTSYILCEKKPRELFVGLFCLGVLYSVCIHITSNQYFYIISVALTSSNLAGFVFLSQLIREMRETPDNICYAACTKRVSFVLIAFLIVLQAGFQISAKTRHVFWDSEPKYLTSEITDGPAKGLKTTQNNYNNYYNIYNDLKIYETKERDNILFLTSTTYTYLSVEDYPYGTYSAWLSGENDKTIQRLKDYYELNPDKIPRYIYIPKSSSFDIQSIINEAQANGYTVAETNVSYQLEKSN